ncbi:hypothetical protein HN747_03615 [archaeon]|nr:hypothetical protein [archaeon]
MFKESYIGNHRIWKDYQARGDHIEVVTQKARSVLAPAEKLVKEYSRLRKSQGGAQNEVVGDWWDSVFVPSYMEKIRDDLVVRQRISWLSWKEHMLQKDGNSLWVVSYKGPDALQGTRRDHRFMLLDILEGRIKL